MSVVRAGSDPQAVEQPFFEVVAVGSRIPPNRAGEIDELRHIGIALGLMPGADGGRSAPMLVLLDRAAKVLSPFDVHRS